MPYRTVPRVPYITSWLKIAEETRILIKNSFRLASKNFVLSSRGTSVRDPETTCFWASRIRLWILPFSHKGVERTEIMLAK